MSLKTLICYFLLICTAHANEGGLAITVEPSDAEIYLNGQLKTNSSPAHLIVLEGKHWVEVKKAGMNTESFEILIPADGTVVKKITLTPIALPPPPPPAPVVETKPNLFALLQPERGKFETEGEFATRRAKLLIEFNQAVVAHQPQFQIGTATLNHANYDLDSGTFPVQIEWADWAKSFTHVQKLSQQNIAALRDDAQSLWQEGEKKPLFAYFKLGKHVAEVDKIVLMGLNKEWRVEPVTGHLFIALPNFLNELANKLLETYQTKFPYAHLHPTVRKSDGLFDALLTNETNFVMTHRKMNEAELAAFEKKYEYEAVGIKIAMKMYAVYVHNDNPLTGANSGFLDAIFSATASCSSTQGVYHSWGEFGEEMSKFRADEWKFLSISLYGAKQGTLTHQFFKEVVLCGGEFKSTMKQLDEQQVPRFASNDKANIGFAEFQPIEPNLPVHTLRIRNQQEVGYFSSGEIEPTRENALSGKYPLAHYIWIYVNKPPKSALPPVEQKMIDFMLSHAGQEILENLGFISLPEKERIEQSEIVR
jgi:phosphate transport system substrate-binding protein